MPPISPLAVGATVFAMRAMKSTSTIVYTEGYQEHLSMERHRLISVCVRVYTYLCMVWYGMV